MLNKCKIIGLTITNKVGHFCKTTEVLPDFHMFVTNLQPNHTVQKERKSIKATSSNIVTSSSSF